MNAILRKCEILWKIKEIHKVIFQYCTPNQSHITSDRFCKISEISMKLYDLKSLEYYKSIVEFRTDRTSNK